MCLNEENSFSTPHETYDPTEAFYLKLSRAYVEINLNFWRGVTRDAAIFVKFNRGREKERLRASKKLNLSLTNIVIARAYIYIYIAQLYP